MSETNGKHPPEDDASHEVYVLSDEDHLRCLVTGAAQLGIVPAEIVARVRRARFDQVANGMVLSVWLRSPTAPPAPPPDPESIRTALVTLGLEIVPSVSQIARWTRAQLEEVARWTMTTTVDGPSVDLPEVLQIKPRKARPRPPTKEPN